MHLPKRPFALRSVSALVLAAGLALSGCDRESASDKAIFDAGIRLQSITGGSASPGVPQSLRKSLYEQVVQDVASFTDSGTNAQQSAARLLKARAVAGLADISAENAAELERTFLGKLGIARARIDQWMSQNSVAAALRVYDPETDINTLNQQRARLTQEAETFQRQADEIQSRVDELNRQAAAAAGSAREKRAQIADLRRQSEGQSQVQRLATLEQGAKISREADQLDQSAAMLQAEAAKLVPGKSEVDREINRRKTQSDLLVKAGDDARALAKSKAATSDKAREEALEGARTLDAVLKELADQRQAISSPTASAVKQYTDASTTAKSAAGVSADKSRASATISSAAYQHSLADTRATQARSLAAYVGVLDLIVDAKPEIPSRASVVSARDAAKAELDTVKQEAEQAYKTALEGYESGSGNNEDDKKRIEQIKQKLSRIMSGDNAPPAAPTDAEAAPASGGESTTPAADAGAMPDEASIRTAVDAMRADVLGSDVELAISHLHFSSPAVGSTFKEIVAQGAFMADLDNACKEKFGKSLKELVETSQADSVKNNPLLQGMKGNLSGGMGSMMQGADKLLGAESKIRVVSAGEAELTAEGVDEGLTLVKSADTGDQWKIKVDVPEDQLPMLKMAGGMLKPLEAPIKALAADVRAGKYATGDEMLIDLQAKIMGAMMPGRPGGAPPAGTP